MRKLKAQSICDFFDAPLISDQIAGRRNHYRLRSISVRRRLSPVPASGAGANCHRPYRRRSRGFRSLPRPPAGGAAPGCHAERIDADHWRVPADLPERGQAYDLGRDRANIRISILSPTGLDSQIGHDGATWLDRELASPSRTTLANTGFGREVTEAMERRRQSLVNMGHAARLKDGRIHVSKDFIANLERTEVTRVGKAMAAERGLKFTAAKTGEYVSGTLIGSIQLASDRFAMIDDGIGFQLVPWQPLLEKRIGQHITGIERDAGSIEWSFARKRGLGI